MRKLLILLAPAAAVLGQTPPPAPQPQIVLAQAGSPPPAGQAGAPPPQSGAQSGNFVPQSGTRTAPPPLNRAQAEDMALRNNPRITVSRLLTLAQAQTIREARAAELPLANGFVTGEQANNGSRFGYSSLSSTRLLTHAGGGVVVSQLITDFGRTHNLVASAKLQAEAQHSREAATRDQLLLVTDQAFYNALQTQAVLRVAQQTVATRQAVQAQIGGLARNNLRSTLDASLADVNVSQAQLLVLDAQNNAAAAIATLDDTLGLDHAQEFALQNDSGAPPPPPPDLPVLTQMAFRQRPDLQVLTETESAQQRLSRAQADQRLPSLTALGTVGGDPVRTGRYFPSSWDGGIAGNLQIPIFNGFLYSAQAKETALRAQATGAEAQALRDDIVRDVKTAWLTANNTFARINVSAQLLTQANGALKLAQTRYTLGLASIAELSQAQLAQTEAEIGFTNAGYSYRAALAGLRFQTGQ